MKVAISLPDPLFTAAEELAGTLRVSRSQLYATAIAEFLARRQTSKVTERLNEIYLAEPAKLDPALNLAQSKSLESDSW